MPERRGERTISRRNPRCPEGLHDEGSMPLSRCSGEAKPPDSPVCIAKQPPGGWSIKPTGTMSNQTDLATWASAQGRHDEHPTAWADQIGTRPAGDRHPVTQREFGGAGTGECVAPVVIGLQVA